jgi:DUF1365 family protein
MKPLAPSLCRGEVFHRRLHPTVHEFRYPVSYVWFDPDHPAGVADAHPLWSSTRPAPARFRASDYGGGGAASLGDQVRDDVAGVLGFRPTGPVRMLTQWRRWGWLFNPITVYLAWHDDPGMPAGVVLEVTNTPWKERHRYASAVRGVIDADGTGDRVVASIDKVLHVSPFLDEGYTYDVAIGHHGSDEAGTLTLAIDVVGPDGVPVLLTGARLDQRPVDRRTLTAALRADGLPTHRVSAGIHAQAARLWRKRVAFVPHPDRRRSGAVDAPPTGHVVDRAPTAAAASATTPATTRASIPAAREGEPVGR